MLNTLIEELRSTTKPAQKIDILLAHDSKFFRYFLWSSYEPFEMYHVKLKPEDIPEPGRETMDDPVVQMAAQEVIEHCRHSNSNKKNRFVVSNFLKCLDKGSQELLIGLVHKNWKVGISASTINKAYPELITVFDVQLANSYDKAIKKKKFQKKTRLKSDKLDGLRGVWLRIEGQWVANSREGKEYHTVSHHHAELEKIYEKHGFSFLDGEFHVDGLEFEEIQSLVTSFTKGTHEEIGFRCFIAGTYEDFDNQIADNMVVFEEEHESDGKLIRVLEQTPIEDDEVYDALEDAFDREVEGIMLRDPDELYNFKRSDALLKLKKSKNDNSQEIITDALVLDIVIDDFPVVINETIVYKKLLTKLVLEQPEGITCKCGSGFDLKLREAVAEDPYVIKGKVVEIAHQRYGKNGRFRFPRLHRIREDLTWPVDS